MDLLCCSMHRLWQTPFGVTSNIEQLACCRQNRNDRANEASSLDVCTSNRVGNLLVVAPTDSAVQGQTCLLWILLSHCHALHNCCVLTSLFQFEAWKLALWLFHGESDKQSIHTFVCVMCPKWMCRTAKDLFILKVFLVWWYVLSKIFLLTINSHTTIPFLLS